MKNAVIVIAEKNFQDIEYSETRKELENSGIPVKVASKTKGMKKGVLGSGVDAELSLKDVKTEDFSCIVFIGGNGATQYINDKDALDLARAFFNKGKITAAICIAPLILASAGILKGKKAAVWDDGKGTQIRQLESKGAEFTPEDAVIDGNIITANGPAAAKAFGKAIAEEL